MVVQVYVDNIRLRRIPYGALIIVGTWEEMGLRILLRPYRAHYFSMSPTQGSGAALLHPGLVYSALTGLGGIMQPLDKLTDMIVNRY